LVVVTPGLYAPFKRCVGRTALPHPVWHKSVLFMQVEKSTDIGYHQNWSFQPNTILLARLYIVTELPDDLKRKKRCWHLKEKALEYTLWRNRFWKAWSQDTPRNDWDAFILKDWGKPWK
jgi:hypothetical protein